MLNEGSEKHSKGRGLQNEAMRQNDKGKNCGIDVDGHSVMAVHAWL